MDVMSTKAPDHSHLHANAARVSELERAAWEAFGQGLWAEALARFHEALQIDSASEGALQGAIAALRKERKFDKASAFLAQALLKRPTSRGILSERVWLEVDQRNYAAAADALDEVLRHPGPAAAQDNTAELLAWKASLLRTTDRFEEASAVIRQALQSFPHSIELLIQLAWLQFYQNRLTEAADTFAQVLKTDPENEAALQGKIATLRLQGQFALAKREAAIALGIIPTSTGIQSEMGWILFACEDFDKAESAFREVLKRSPQDASSRVNLAWVLLKEPYPDALADAAAQCQEALQLEPDLPEAMSCLGIVAFRQGRVLEAEHYLVRSIKAGRTRGAYADLGALYVHMARFDAAKKILDEGLALKPNDAALHLEMGSLCAQQEKPKEAILEFRQATALDPTNPEFTRALAISLLENGKANEAELLLRQAIKNLDESKGWRLHLALSQVLVKIAEDSSDPTLMGEALKEVNSALRLQSDQADPHFYSGIVRFKLDDLPGSLRAFRRCHEIDKNRIEAELNAKRVQAMIRDSRVRSTASLAASFVVGTVTLCQLAGLWFLHLRYGEKGPVSSTMITVLVPVCLGLLVVSVLLPSLTKLKLTGLEAELSEPKPKAVAGGPKGQIGFDRSYPGPGGI
jgi:tetratricopeptide (TPR) repeat protein